MRLLRDGLVGLLQAFGCHELPRFHQRSGFDVNHHGPETEEIVKLSTVSVSVPLGAGLRGKDSYRQSGE